MKWSKQAKEAVARVPFFVRKRVRKKVEEEAVRSGGSEVRFEHVAACQRRFLSNMEDEVKGYRVETCFGSGGCPNRAVSEDDFVRRVEELLARRNLRDHIKKHVKGPLKLHHEFRVSISDCPNACSRPQIVDIGLIGAHLPKLSDEPCSQCGSCIEICREDAISMPDGGERPVIDPEKCLSCGQCLTVCPTGALQESQCGYRILVGGKLGRHPQLARDLGRIFPADEALNTIEKCLEHHLKHNQSGERFGEILNRNAMDEQ